MRRLLPLLAALSYLLPQAGAFLHAEEAFEACSDCEGLAARLECADEDCGRADHHHARHHHPGTCRTCTAVGPSLSEAAFALPLASPVSWLPPDPLDLHGSAVFIGGTIRAPPGDAASPACPA